jgi:hypothetical protein
LLGGWVMPPRGARLPRFSGMSRTVAAGDGFRHVPHVVRELGTTPPALH